MPIPNASRGSARRDLTSVVTHLAPALQPPEGAILVRLPVHGAHTLASLPPVPAPHRVTISLGDPSLRAFVPPGGLEELGYHLVGAHDAGGIPVPEALVLVPKVLQTAQPAWLSRLLARADKAYALDLGPVRTILRTRIERHLAFMAVA